MSEDEDILAIASRRVGTVLNGKYRIERVLGVGGMATVYAATHRNRKQFAVKMLHPEFSVRRDVRSRFVREGYVANSVDHPGVVAVLDDDVDDTGAAFLVMELLEGVTVEALYSSAGSPIPVREALGIVCQLLDVLQAAHAKSVIHRDIKPANLFVLNDGQLKVVDFGIARLREGEPELKSTRTGAMLGTPAFMPPEQALALPSDIDARTDVWAVGATLFTMLSARFVHEGENARQMMIRAATEPARSLGSVAPSVPPAVVELVTRALMFERHARWQSAAAMREAVLGVHRDLFGEPSQTDLSTLIAKTAAVVQSSPTEPSPAPSQSPRDSRTTVADVPGPLVVSSRALVSTTSRPVSTGGGNAKGAKSGIRIVGGIAAALLGAGLVLALTKRPTETTAATPAAKGVGSALPRPAEPEAVLSAGPSLTAEKPASSPPSLIVAPRAAPSALAEPPPRTAAPPRRTASPTPSSVRALPHSLTTSQPAGSQSHATATDNPLHLQLQ